MSGLSASLEKRRYWERRLTELLRPLPIEDLLIMSWAIEAFREGETVAARKYAQFPGCPEEYKITGRYFVPPWNVEAVVNERMLFDVAALGSVKRINLKSWSAISKLLNTYNGLANVESTMDYSQQGVISAMPRLFWPQYDWQLGVANNFRIARSWHVYAHPKGKEAFFEKHNVKLDQFLKVIFAIYGGTRSYPAIRFSTLVNSGTDIGVSQIEILNSLRVIGKTFVEHAGFSTSIRNPNIPRDFNRKASKESPLYVQEMRGDAQIFVPSRHNLMLRMTDGLYYDIVQDSKARNASGEFFEDLCFQLLEHYSDSGFSAGRERSTSYGKSADLFLSDAEGEIKFIVECKSRRLPSKVLTSPDPWRDCFEDFEDIIKGIVQIWRTHNEFDIPREQNVAGVVLLYDPWTLLGNSFIQDLFNKANEMADQLSIPNMSRIPVALSGYADFELCLRSYSIRDIHLAACGTKIKDFHGYLLSGILERIEKLAVQKDSFDYQKTIGEAVPWFTECLQETSN